MPNWVSARQQYHKMMKTYTKRSIPLNIFTFLLTVILVCVACGKKDNSTNTANTSDEKVDTINQEDMYNPAMRFTAYKPTFYEKKDLLNGTEESYLYSVGDFKGIKVFDTNGEVKYSDEDAEKYYQHYVANFFFAYKIAKATVGMSEYEDAKTISYLKDNLFDIVCNLPLNNSYPSYIRETINEIYYDNKDMALNMSLYKRGYGYVEFRYNEKQRFCIYREENSGFLIAQERY